MWALWDRIKKALETDSTQWSAKARELWVFLTDIDAGVREAAPLRCAVAYGYWLTARDIETWTPPAGPLQWTAPARGRAGEAEFLDQIRIERENTKAALRAQSKQHLKAYRAEMRAAKKAAQKEKV